MIPVQHNPGTGLDTGPKRKKWKRTPKRLQGFIAEHAAEKALQIRKKYGPQIDYHVLQSVLEDPKCTRYPVTIKFDSSRIEPGLFALTEPVDDDHPEEGYVITLHEGFSEREDVLPALVLYQLVIVNYEDLSSAADAEIFGSGVLDMDRDDYYKLICDVTDSIWSA